MPPARTRQLISRTQVAASALIAYCLSPGRCFGAMLACPFTRHGFTERGEDASLLMPTGRQNPDIIGHLLDI